MTPSSPQLASLWPSGLTLSDWTAPRCPICTLRHSPRCTSHQRSIPSLPPLSSSALVGLHASAYTIALGSLQAYRRSPLCASQMTSSPVPRLPPPLASRVPSSLQPTLPTMPPSPPTSVTPVPPQPPPRSPWGGVAAGRGARKRPRASPVVASDTRTTLSHPLLARS